MDYTPVIAAQIATKPQRPATEQVYYAQYACRTCATLWRIIQKLGVTLAKPTTAPRPRIGRASETC